MTSDITSSRSRTLTAGFTSESYTTIFSMRLLKVESRVGILAALVLLAMAEFCFAGEDTAVSREQRVLDV